MSFKLGRGFLQLKYYLKSTSANGLRINVSFKERDNIAREAAEK
jgi:hypothetical protein